MQLCQGVWQMVLIICSAWFVDNLKQTNKNINREDFYKSKFRLSGVYFSTSIHLPVVNIEGKKAPEATIVGFQGFQMIYLIQ